MEKHLANEQLAAFLAGKLKAEARGRVRGHLLGCRLCALALSRAVAESMTPELRDKFHRPMPRPPMPVLESLGIQNDQEGTVWTTLQSLDTERIRWAQEEMDAVRRALRVAVSVWAFVPVTTRTRGLHRGGTRSPTLGPGEEWPHQVDIEVVNSSGQPQGRTVRFEVIEPPTMTPAGEFVAVLRTDEGDLAGWSLRCTVMAAEERKVTFAGELRAEVDNRGWRVWIEATGLPANKEPTLIPANFVQWSLQERP
jgi:hypothetical protein